MTDHKQSQKSMEIFSANFCLFMDHLDPFRAGWHRSETAL